jgi:hypothetical protein
MMVLVFLCTGISSLFAQGITTGAIAGRVVSSTGEEMPGVNIIAVHTPSGTTYGTNTRENGSYIIPNIRVGGPYTVTASFIGYRKVVRENVYTAVSQTSDLNFSLKEEAIQAADEIITGERSTVMNASRTGAGTSVDRQTLTILPTITGKIQDFIRLTPESRRVTVEILISARIADITIRPSMAHTSITPLAFKVKLVNVRASRLFHSMQSNRYR